MDRISKLLCVTSFDGPRPRGLFVLNEEKKEKHTEVPRFLGAELDAHTAPRLALPEAASRPALRLPRRRWASRSATGAFPTG